MKSSQVEIERHFAGLFGQHPKRARLGYGSFLTLDFGRSSKQHHRITYEWQLWIQHANWQLIWKGQQIASSETNRQVAEAAVRRLETRMLEKVVHHSDDKKTRFGFSGDVDLVCSAYPDSNEDEYCWSLYTPDAHVLLADHLGNLHYRRSDVAEPVHSATRQ